MKNLDWRDDFLITYFSQKKNQEGMDRKKLPFEIQT